MTAELILNAWVDANLLLILIVALLLPLARRLSVGSLQHAMVGQTRALEWVVLTVIAAPLLVRIAGGSLGGGLNLSDLLVAQYLSGNVAMSAARFEGLLGLREELVTAFMMQQALWAQVALALLCLGALGCVIRLGWMGLRLWRIVHRAHSWRRFGRLELLISNDTSVAFSTCGVHRRYVVLPSNVLGHGKDLHFTLAHEFQHLRQNDLAYEFAIELLRPIFLWNPAFHLWSRHLREMRELACDQALTLRRPLDLKGYCTCLIRASFRARTGAQTFVPRHLLVGFIGVGQQSALDTQLGRRIVVLTGAMPSAVGQRWWKAIGVAMCLSLLFSAAMMRSPTGWSHDRIMLSTIVNLERLDDRNARLAQASLVVE